MEGLRIGTFELYPSERLLLAVGQPVDLGARAFDLLLALADHAGQLVTKAVLLDRVWPGLVVDENNLPTQIASLRRVLGPGAIQTVPGFGYRLQVAVERLATPPPGPSAGTPPLADSARPSEHALSAGGPAAGTAASASGQERAGQPPTAAVQAWPNRLSPLVGREEDVRQVLQALGRSALVTIVGIAGVGKTRLAQEIQAREAHAPAASTAWVSLATVTEIAHVPSSIARALGLQLPDGVDGFTALRQALADLPRLLILDNTEHLAGALAAPLAALVSQTRALRILLTSQVPLGIPGEGVHRLSVLPIPELDASLESAAQYGAIALFVQRATAVDRRFALSAENVPLVIRICRRLDGIPLALELAAARVPALGLAALLERLDDRFRLLRLSGQPDARHGALLTAFDWSYGLLTGAEQRAFNWLGVFAGSFSLLAASACVSGEGLDGTDAIDLVARLVDRSLVSLLAVDPPRYVLPETARFYARQRLAANGELQAAQSRMAETLLGTLDRAYEEYWSLDEAVWLHRYEPELDNVRAALDWAVAAERPVGVELFGSAWPLLLEADVYAEGRARYSQLLALLSASLPRPRIGRFWEAIATFDSLRQGDRARYAAELAASHHAAGTQARSRYYALMLLAFNSRADAAAARAAFDAARRIEEGSWPARLLAYGALTEGALLTDSARYAEARVAYQRAVRLALTTSERQALAATVSLVELDVACGDTAAALQLARPLALGLNHLGRREARFELLVLTFSALLLAQLLPEACATGAELYDLARQLDMSRLYTVLDAMALLACREGRFAAAARIVHCADSAHLAHGQVRRSPCAQRMRAAATDLLDEHLGPRWLDARAAGAHEALNEATACLLALGRHDD